MNSFSIYISLTSSFYTYTAICWKSVQWRWSESDCESQSPEPKSRTHRLLVLIDWLIKSWITRLWDWFPLLGQAAAFPVKLRPFPALGLLKSGNCGRVSSFRPFPLLGLHRRFCALMRASSFPAVSMSIISLPQVWMQEPIGDVNHFAHYSPVSSLHF